MKTILSMSISGGVMIAALLLLKPLLKEKLSKSWQYYIWLIVILRLLMPISMEASVMNRSFAEAPLVMEQQMQIPQQPQTMLTEPSAPQLAPVTPPVKPENTISLEIVPISPSVEKPDIDWKDIAQQALDYSGLLWFAVAAGLFVRKIIIYQRFVRHVRRSWIPVSEAELLDHVAMLTQRLGITKAIDLCISPAISTPMLIGFTKPRVLLPQASISPSELEYTILHELTHYKRKDMLYKWLVQLTLCMHWFNPLVYLMEKEISRSCELSCDEAVIKNLDGSGKRAYGNTLINAAGKKDLGSNLASVTLSENGELLKERLLAILHYRKMSKRLIALALSLTLLLTACGTVLGAYVKREGEEQSEASLPTEEENSGWELPPVSEPDEDGNFPPIYENAWNRYVNGKIGPPMEQGDLSKITPFMETLRCLKWLEETYPEIDDWNVLYEKHRFEYVSEAYDPYTFQRRGQYIPSRTVILATEQSEQFDRLFIDSSVWCDVFFVNDSGTDNDMYYPREVLTATVSYGWENDWQLENYADITVRISSEYAFPYLWNPKNNRAVLLDDGKSYPIGDVDEEPWGLRSAIYNKAQHGEGNWYMELMKDDQVKAAYYNDNSQQLTVFEQSENASQLLIESDRLILQAMDKILFYDIGDHFSAKPVKIIGGDGNGLSDKSIEICSIHAENDDCSEFAIFYHCLDENEWHICSFDQYGEIRSNFNTGLAAVKDMIHIEGCYIKDGVLYFRYYPNGMGYRDPYTDYEVNLRESSIVPAISSANYHFVLGDHKEGKTLAVGDEIGSWKLDNLEMENDAEGNLVHQTAF